MQVFVIADFHEVRFILKLKILSSFLLASAIMLGLPCLTSYAAEKTQDGITLSVTADKSVYSKDDNITADITLENNSDSDITDVTLEGIIPDGYHLSESSQAVLRATYIMSGDSISSELVFVPDKMVQVTTAPAASAKETVVTESVTTSETAVNTTVTEPLSVSADNENDNGNPGNGMKLLIAGLLVLTAGVGLIAVKKKGRGKITVILLCAAASGSFITQTDAEAEGSGTYTFSVSETVTAEGQTYDITASVKYTMEISDMQAAVEEYYEDNSEEIVAVEDAKETEQVFSEKEAIRFMSERGFNEYPLTYDYNMDGTYTDEAEASPDSDAKHPMYQTFYVASDGSIWSVFIVGRTIAANPASYNLESDIDAQILVSETDTLTSYTEMGNKFYKTVPKESAVLLKVVEKITSEKLDKLNYDEVTRK